MRETNKIIFKWVDNVKPEVDKREKKNFYMQIQQLNYVYRNFIQTMSKHKEPQF